MIKHADSHLDHNLTEGQIAFIFERFAKRDALFVESIELPEDLGTVESALCGPLVGDAPIIDEQTYAVQRGERTWTSRMIDRAPKQTRTVTVIAGPHDGQACVLFTAYGGPLAPQEPNDPGCKDVEASRKFWADHALARPRQ